MKPYSWKEVKTFQTGYLNRLPMKTCNYAEIKLSNLLE